jgi:hypothetical protein
MGAAVVAVAAAVIAGVALLDSPRTARARSVDLQRARDLYALSRAVNVYWTRNDRLPEDLNTFTQVPGFAAETTDPVSRTSYEYRVTGIKRYELCATFEAESTTRLDYFWAHGPGRQCFEFEPLNESAGDYPYP